MTKHPIGPAALNSRAALDYREEDELLFDRSFDGLLSLDEEADLTRRLIRERPLMRHLFDFSLEYALLREILTGNGHKKAATPEPKAPARPRRRSAPKSRRDGSR
ncbi:MAG: hypothetical protein HY716_04080 [Planctomycetes bacterium]|nr:hypothetical protein [Planctomycetota bacterium]